MHENLHGYIEDMTNDKRHPNAVANLRNRMQDIYDDLLLLLIKILMI